MSAPTRKRRNRKLHLAGHTIALKFAKLDAAECFEDAESGDASVFGFYDPSGPAIYIDPAHSDTQNQDTLIHESLHAIDDQYQLNISHAKIHLIASALQQMLAPYLKKI